MTADYFKHIAPLQYEGPDSANPLAFRYYQPERMIAGKSMRDHLRLGVCYWHTFCWPGTDPFGAATFERPWFGRQDPMQAAKDKADAAFALFEILGVPYFTFHDRDIAPEGDNLAQSNRNVRLIAEIFADKMAQTGIGLLWGTANLFSNRRYMAGAATNPDPEVFAYAAAQVKNILEVTQALGGENYVLWGGREGYETLLNTDMKKELDQVGRFMNLVVEHKHKIGFDGMIMIEPKPREPTKQQYDFDVAAVSAFLQTYGLEQEICVNIEQNHAILAGHTFEHEIANAFALGIFGSIDMNRGDYQSGWDTDQFAANLPEVSLALYEILRGGGFTTGGLNFDAKLRRQSLDPEDVVYAHLGGIDTCAQGLLIAARMLEDGDLANHVAERYRGWQAPRWQDVLKGTVSLETLAHWVETETIEPTPVSGRQEYLENLVNRYVQPAYRE